MPVDHQKNMRPTMVAAAPGGVGPQSIGPSPSSTASSLFSSSQQMMPSPSSTAASFSPVIPPPVPQRTLPRMESPTLGRRPQSDIVLPSFNELIQNVQLPSFDPSSQSSASRPVSAPPETNPGAYNSLQRALRVQQQTSAQLPSSQHFFSASQQQQQAPASPLHHFPQQLSQQLPSPSHGSPFLFQQQPGQQQSPLFGQQEQAPRQRFGTTGGFLPTPSSPAQGFGDQFTRELKQAQQYQQQQFKHEQQYQQATAPAPSHHQQQQQQTQFTYSAPQQRNQGQYDNAVVIPRGGSQASAESSTRGQQQQPDMVFNSGQYGDSRHPHAPQLSSNLQPVSRLPFDSQHHQQQAGQYWQGGANGTGPGALNRSGNGNDQYSFVPMFVEPKAPSRSHPPVVLNPHSKKTRSNFPKEIISILKKWLATHWDNPYPSSEDKRILMAQTGLDKKQIINWFINARRRLVLPKKGQVSSPSSGPPAILFSDDESDEDDLSDEDLANPQHGQYDDDDSNTEDNDQVMSAPGSQQQYYQQQQQQQQQQVGPNAMSPRPFHRKAPVRRPSAPVPRTMPSEAATSTAVSSLISMRQQAFNPSF
eukprot:TRINITY_DN1148_c2_g1_i5.p1 TRINITY_DN1148_c2_g1~~TRINITY_DN1148_c2_g1_i5.p1  ORF type:complete len:589 (-),score=265.99 TRINITY_DN1148_c2_g1_i5:5-1771(-)